MRILLKVFVLLICFTHIYAQSADDIINKHFEATGGKALWAKVVNMQMSGNYLMGPGLFAPVKALQVSQPFKGYYSEFNWQGMKSMSAMKGDAGWSYNPFGGKRQADPVSPQTIRSWKLSADPQGLFFNYKEKGYTSEYLGMDDMDGSEVHKIRLTNKEGDMIYYYIDASSFYVLKISKRIKLKDKEVKEQQVYSDFRKTTFGVIMPFSVQGVDDDGNEAGGPTNFDKIEINTSVDAALFDMPANK